MTAIFGYKEMMCMCQMVWLENGCIVRYAYKEAENQLKHL